MRIIAKDAVACPKVDVCFVQKSEGTSKAALVIKMQKRKRAERRVWVSITFDTFETIR